MKLNISLPCVVELSGTSLADLDFRNRLSIFKKFHYIYEESPLFVD